MKNRTWTLQPRILADYLERELNNGHYRLTFTQIALGLWAIKVPTKAHIEVIRHAWQQAQKQLRRRGTCAILVTEFYFDIFNHKEPRNPEAIKLCLALQYKAYGVRLLTMKGAVNDPMALMYFQLRSRNVGGMAAAIADRVAVEYGGGKLTKVKARGLIQKLTEFPLPEHQTEFNDLTK